MKKIQALISKRMMINYLKHFKLILIFSKIYHGKNVFIHIPQNSRMIMITKIYQFRNYQTWLKNQNALKINSRPSRLLFRIQSSVDFSLIKKAKLVNLGLRIYIKHNQSKVIITLIEGFHCFL